MLALIVISAFYISFGAAITGPCKTNDDCGTHGWCWKPPMMTSTICGCAEGYLLNSTDSVCYPNPTWCKTAADCATGHVCCSFAPCDGRNVQECMRTREACLAHPGCASGGVVVDEERMQADEAKKNETSSSEEERSRENERNQQRRRQKKKGRNN